MRTKRCRCVWLVLSAVSAATPGAETAPSTWPHYDHVVVVVMENHSYTPVIGNADAPYINLLVEQGANFLSSYALTHPSQPNYLALFSGSTQGVTNNACPIDLAVKDNLGAQMLRANLTFAGYSEDLPATGFRGCENAGYRRKHNPWVAFDNVPASSNLPFAAFPTDFDRLPALAFVVPNLCHDMHDCSVAVGDAWLRAHIDDFAHWAPTHDSLLILTFDEDDSSADNRIPTVFVGAHIRRGAYPERIDHYRVLATLETLFGLPRIGHAARATPIHSAFTEDP